MAIRTDRIPGFRDVGESCSNCAYFTEEQGCLKYPDLISRDMIEDPAQNWCVGHESPIEEGEGEESLLEGQPGMEDEPGEVEPSSVLVS